MKLLKALGLAISAARKAYGDFETVSRPKEVYRITALVSGQRHRFDKINDAIEFAIRESTKHWKTAVAINGCPILIAHELPWAHKYQLEPDCGWVKIGLRTELNVDFTTKDCKRSFGL